MVNEKVPPSITNTDNSADIEFDNSMSESSAPAGAVSISEFHGHGVAVGAVVGAAVGAVGASVAQQKSTVFQCFHKPPDDSIRTSQGPPRSPQGALRILQRTPRAPRACFLGTPKVLGRALGGPWVRFGSLGGSWGNPLVGLGGSLGGPHGIMRGPMKTLKNN